MFRFKTNIKQVQQQINKDLRDRIKSLPTQELTLLSLQDIRLEFDCTYEVPVNEINAYAYRLLEQATPKVVRELGNQLQMNMRAGSWGWRDGSRDIVDSGDLMESQVITVSGFEVDISYNSPYAAITHYGGYIYPYGNKNATKVYLPARPWITATIEGGGPVPAFDFYAAYLRAIED